MDVVLTLQELIELPRRYKKKNKKIVVDLSYTKYEVIQRVVTEHFGWTVVKGTESNEWNLQWFDTYAPFETIRQLDSHQKINRFPGTEILGKKNYLAKYLTKMRQMNPESYDYFPQTWNLPQQLEELRLSIDPKGVYIVKPEAGCQGRGIFLTNRLAQYLNYDTRYVVQEYIKNPFLIDDLKFDFRLYVLVKSVSPLKIYMYREGLSRFATISYQKPNPKNFAVKQMHLTNYSINKKSTNFVFNETALNDDIGHKRSFSSVMRLLESRGHDVKKLLEEVQRIIIKTVIAVQPQLAHLYRASQQICFEILGFDILLDSNLKPWLLEVNHTPSLKTDTPLDQTIKSYLIIDTLNLLDFRSVNEPRKPIHLFRVPKLILQSKKEPVSGYQRIYPTYNDDQEFINLLTSAKKLQDELDGIGTRTRNKSDFQAQNIKLIKQQQNNESNRVILMPIPRKPIERRNEILPLKIDFSDKVSREKRYGGKNHTAHGESPVKKQILSLVRGSTQDSNKDKESPPHFEKASLQTILNKFFKSPPIKIKGSFLKSPHTQQSEKNNNSLLIMNKPMNDSFMNDIDFSVYGTKNRMEYKLNGVLEYTKRSPLIIKSFQLRELEHSKIKHQGVEILN